ncbi:MAG TPA: hypothetical protein VMF05_08440 [Stellaceae bacterium]|nr:hypothetical protein [Stellaceae bacterium]
MIRLAAWWTLAPILPTRVLLAPVLLARVLLVGILLAGVLLAGTAEASQPGLTAITKWKTMDACARQAQAAHPDFTAQSNAQRNAQLNACLNANNLPPRQPQQQSPPPQH